MTTSAWSHPAFETLAQFVGTRTGLSFAAHRRADAEARIRSAMSRAKVADLTRYLHLLETGALPLDDLIVELTVGETYFFREPRHFDFVRDEVFPDALGRRGPDHVLRCWSAGCATGEEAYSLAIVLEEAGRQGQIRATDISRAALQRAREATYRRWALRGVDEARLDHWFHRTDSRWALDGHIARQVTFECHNLAAGTAAAQAAGLWDMDLILCRNVLIYFDKESISRVAQTLHASLADGGWLITGPSDPPLGDVAPFATVVSPSGVFYRKGRIAQHASAPTRMAPACATEQDRMPVVSDAIRQELPRPDVSPHKERPDAIVDAQGAFEAGDYDRVLVLTLNIQDEITASLRVRALANSGDSELAAREAHNSIERFPFSTELHVLHAILLMNLGRDDQAIAALKRARYLDRTLVIASFLLASVLRRQGQLAEARRAYRNARDLARLRPPDEPLPLADGERAGRIVEIAEAEMARLDGQRELSA